MVAAAAPLARLRASLADHALDAALLASPPAVTYASGFEVPLPGGYGSEVTRWLPALALVTSTGGWLIVSEDDRAGARASSWLELLPFDALAHFSPSRPLETWRDALREALSAARLGRGARIGVEPSLPHEAAGITAEACPGAALLDVSTALHAARSQKTGWEVERLRAATRLADAAQRRLLELAVEAAGASDVEVWNDIVRALHTAAGRAVALTGVLVSGPATAAVNGGPVGRRIEAGDPVLLDISPRLDGYWSDCANTVVAGGRPSRVQLHYLSAAQRACEEAIAKLRPGARCSEPALALQASLERDGIPMIHYAGHQLGTGVNELPRLLTIAEERVEEGMVFAVEAGAYGGEREAVGARCEKVALVTAGGPELLSQFDWTPS